MFLGQDIFSIARPATYIARPAIYIARPATYIARPAIEIFNRQWMFFPLFKSF